MTKILKLLKIIIITLSFNSSYADCTKAVENHLRTQINSRTDFSHQKGIQVVKGNSITTLQDYQLLVLTDDASNDFNVFTVSYAIEVCDNFLFPLVFSSQVSFRRHEATVTVRKKGCEIIAVEIHSLVDKT